VVNLAEWIGVLVGAGGLVFAALAWWSSRRSVRLSEEQLKLAREQAERHPELKGRVWVKPGLRNPAFGRLIVEVANTGKTAAHHVHGWIYFDANHLSPYEPPSGRFSISISDIRRSWGESCSTDQEPEDGFYQA